MKKFLCIILIISLLTNLCGCGLLSQKSSEPIIFYYRRAEFDYHSDAPVMVAEEREVSGHTDDLLYMLTLYLVGPLDDTLVSPFPEGTRCFSAEQENEDIRLILSDLDGMLNDASFSLACACISMTCMNLTGASRIIITSGQRTITITEDNLLLTDNLYPTVNPTEEPQ